MTDPAAFPFPDPTTVAALETAAARLIDKIPFRSAKDRIDIVKFALQKGLPTYLAANYAKCQTLKTLLNRNHPIPLEDCFVAPDFEFQESIIPSTRFLHEVSHSGGKVVLTGLAGSGKSVFLKYSFRQIIEEGYSFYPIFFELRTLNGLSAKSRFLVSAIFDSIRTCCDSFTRAQFDHGLKNGAFYFLLDGYDELKHEIREQVSIEITTLARNHHKCAIIVTSRPSDEFLSWEGFSEASLLPFNLDKAVEYISKLSFDEEKKQEFLNDLKNELFEKHEDFLSNPLLSAMMLLTYDSFGEIPEKRHVFYSKCFEVLAREHDASKGRYKRELYSDIVMDHLERIFMFFCAVSYVERQFSFSEDEMKKYVSSAISLSGVEADVTAVVMDFRESISIIELVGLSYEFAHRSFQEYFYARFVVADRRLSLEQKIGDLCENFTSENTIEMIADMDRTYFEDEFLLPEVKSLDARLATIDPLTNPAGVLSKFYARVHTGKGRDQGEKARGPIIFYTFSNGRNSFILYQATEKYDIQISGELGRTRQERTERIKEQIDILSSEFGGEIKIHHTNNRRLIRAGVNLFAVRIKNTVSLLRQQLENGQQKRRQGLGVLIRSRYKRD